MTSYAAKLILTADGGEKEFFLRRSELSVGRAAANDIVLSDPKVSRIHAHLEEGETAWSVRDAGSANGVEVNGKRVENVDLQPGDQIRIGDNLLRFEKSESTPEADTVHIDSEAELDQTLAQTMVPIMLVDTSCPRLTVYTQQKTWEIPLHQEMVSIGRQGTNDIELQTAKASRLHARIERIGDGFVIRDLDSTNGTWLAGQRIEEHILQSGDTIHIGDAQLIFKSSIDVGEPTLVATRPGLASQARRPVIFVPGIMGSELWRGNERLWPNVRRLFSEPDALRLPDKHPVEPRGIVQDMVVVPNLIELEQYSPLTTYLQEELGYQKEVDLFEFAYDWRQPLADTALRLAEAVDTWSITPPFTIIAHSMGCLISRYYVEQLGGKRNVNRLLMMGGPLQGAPKALLSLLHGPRVLPFGLLGERLRHLVASFPASYHILPVYPCIYDQNGQLIDLSATDTWLTEEQRPLWLGAREFRRKLGMHSSVPSVCIFGYNVKTITRLNLERTQGGDWGVDMANAMDGDGTVPQYSTVLPGADVHPVEQHHGALYVDNDVKMRLAIELTWRSPGI